MAGQAPTVSLILTCFNEIEHIETSLRKISEFMDFWFSSLGYEILLVDDFSSDGTRDWLSNLSLAHTRVHLNEKNLGRGGAVKIGMQMSRGDIVGFMDIDCEVSESYLCKFVQDILKGSDLAIGMRIYRVTAQPYIVLRHLLSLCYKALLRKKMHCKTMDSEVGYKFFSRRLSDFIINQSRFNDWFWDTEVTLLTEKYGFQISEIPVAFQRNVQKTSSVQVFRDSVRYLRSLKKFNDLISTGAYHSPRDVAPKDTPGQKNTA